MPRTNLTVLDGPHCLSEAALQRAAGEVRSSKLAERRAAAARVLADTSRSRILHALEVCGELCVGNLAQVTGIEQSLASHHLRTLRGVGAVTSRRAGKWTYYRLADGFQPGVLDEIGAGLNG